MKEGVNVNKKWRNYGNELNFMEYKNINHVYRHKSRYNKYIKLITKQKITMLQLFLA